MFPSGLRRVNASNSLSSSMRSTEGRVAYQPNRYTRSYLQLFMCPRNATCNINLTLVIYTVCLSGLLLCGKWSSAQDCEYTTRSSGPVSNKLDVVRRQPAIHEIIHHKQSDKYGIYNYLFISHSLLDADTIFFNTQTPLIFSIHCISVFQCF